MTIPLFPLNTVLLPGGLLPLQVFEPRYVEMLNECVKRKTGFGVVLIKSGKEANGPIAAPHRFGCKGVIQEVKLLQGNRYFVLLQGGRTFEIIKLKNDRAFLQAEVEIINLEQERDLSEYSKQLREHLFKYLKAKKQTSTQIPEQVENFPFVAVSLLQVANPVKYRLLQTRGLLEAYQEAISIFRDYEKLQEIHPSPPLDGPFSRN